MKYEFWLGDMKAVAYHNGLPMQVSDPRHPLNSTAVTDNMRKQADQAMGYGETPADVAQPKQASTDTATDRERGAAPETMNAAPSIQELKDQASAGAFSELCAGVTALVDEVTRLRAREKDLLAGNVDLLRRRQVALETLRQRSAEILASANARSSLRRELSAARAQSSDLKVKIQELQAEIALLKQPYDPKVWIYGFPFGSFVLGDQLPKSDSVRHPG